MKSQIGDSEQAAIEAALKRAEAFGIDVSLLRSNLRLSPTERVLRLERFLASVRALQAEVEAWNERETPER